MSGDHNAHQKPAALQLAEMLDWPSVNKGHEAAAELRRLHELAESEGRWASQYLQRAVNAEDRITTLEAALRQAVEALEALEEIHPGNMTPMAEEAWNRAITAAKQALGEQVWPIHLQEKSR